MKRFTSVALASALLIAPLAMGNTALADPVEASPTPSTITSPTLARTVNALAANAAPAASENAAAQTWQLDSATAKGGEVLETSDGWLHFKSATGNGNSNSNPSSYPAVAMNDGEFDFTHPGQFHATIKPENAAKSTRFGFYLGYKNPNNALFIGYDSGGWFWQQYGASGSPWYSGTRVAAPAAGEETRIVISWDGTKATLTVNDQQAFDPVAYNTIPNLTNKIAMKAGTYGSDLTSIFIKDFADTPIQKYSVQGTVTNAEGTAIEGASVSLMEGTRTVATTQTNASGAYSFDEVAEGSYQVSVSKSGYIDASSSVDVTKNTQVDAIALQQEAPVDVETLQTDAMQVQLKRNFPSVYKYIMTSKGGKVMYGQTKDVRDVSINGTKVTLSDANVTMKKNSDTKATYTLTVRDDAKHINVVLTAEITVEANTLHFNITKIENKAGEEHPVQTIAFPNHSLVAVRSGQENAQFTGAIMSASTERPGDENYAVTGATRVTDKDYMYAFVSGDGLSAGLWSNSEHEGRVLVAPVNGGSHNTRIYASTEQADGQTSLGLASAPWYYHRTVTDSKGRKYTVDETDMPKMAVVITGDENADNTVNWQDGAIGFRNIMNNPYKSEEVPELVAWRIAMNFGSQAQNPFLTTLDNVKKVALHTDGLGQSVLLKGYGNEGHDSGHPDYADIGQRIGGAKDMNTLMEKGREYGARFGIHVNASEMYPEAKAFNEDMVRRNASGGLSYGWNWIDQGIGIDGIYDLASGSREARFDALKEEVGDNMDFIYLDVWGNLTSSSSEDSWETRKMSKMINDNGWRMTTEWGSGNEYDSTFQHWAADLTYGGKNAKGENSQVMRFLRNHQKDSWVGDYPRYGGTANAPLLGGYDMRDFEGWQGRNDYDAYIENLYTHDVSTKFIQHFKVSRWVNNPVDSTSVQDPNTNNGNEFIELKDDHGNVVTLARESNNTSSTGYRNRTITFNGTVVASGSVTAGDGSSVGTESYLLPWLWDAKTGDLLGSDSQRLYHWNTQGGSTTWTLPKGWENLASVKVYKLTDLGKTDMVDVPVVSGQITLNADAETPYVVYKGETGQIKVTWSDGMHIVDAGFNGGAQSLEENWNVEGEGTAQIAKSQHSNPMLKLTGKVQASQKLTDLKPGTRYAVLVGVDNRSNGAASITASANGKELASNSTNHSIAKNYVKAYSHNTNSSTVDGNSYFQHMYIFFEAPKSGDVTLKLAHSGEGDVYFDDVRVVENSYDGLKVDEDGKLVSLSNDFEKNVQGIWPFVISGSEGVEDNRIHLSELHEPYTQAGWDVKKMDDVLDGTWSVKVNGLVRKNTLLYQTVPQNVHFEPGVKYTISFDYQSGSDDIYAVAVGEGEFSAKSTQLTNLPKALGTDGHYEFTLTGGVKGNSWFGIYSTASSPNTQGTSGAAANFGGYKDMVLDNLVITRQDPEEVTKEEVEEKIQALRDEFDSRRADFNDASWQQYQEALADIQVLLDKDGSTAADRDQASGMVDALRTFMKSAPGNEDSDAYDIAIDQYASSAGSEQPNYGDYEGPMLFAQDGKEDTYWHTNWSADAVGNGTAWYDFTFAQPTQVNGLRYLPRPGGANTNGKLRRVDIIVTKADGSQETVVTNGEFSTDTVWQKLSFNTVNNVTKVRMLVKASAGSSAAQANKFAAAAELRLTTPREVAQGDVVVDKSELNDTIASAEKLNKIDYKPAGWKTVEAKLAAAKSAAEKQDASLYDVALAQANLARALKHLEAADPLTISTNDKEGSTTAKLGSKIELVAGGFPEGDEVTFTLHSDPVELGKTVADKNGEARLEVTLDPAKVSAGDHAVIASDADGRSVQMKLTVLAADENPGEPDNPDNPNKPDNPDNPGDKDDNNQGGDNNKGGNQGGDQSKPGDKNNNGKNAKATKGKKHKLAATGAAVGIVALVMAASAGAAFTLSRARHRE